MGRAAELSDDAIQLLRETMTAVRQTLVDDVSTPKEKVDAMKVGIAAVNQVLDRTEPKLSTTHEIKTDMAALAKHFARNLPPEQVEKMLQAVESKLLPERISNAGRPKEIIDAP